MLVSMNAYQIGEAVGSGVVIALPAIMTAGATAEAEAAGSVFAAAVETSGETASQVGFFGRSAGGFTRSLGAEAVESSQVATRSEQLAVEGGLFGDGIGAEKYGSIYRQERMLQKGAGYNLSPESWFNEYKSIGREGTFVTDYRAIGEILGPVRANAQYEVSFFSRGNTISYYKASTLEKSLGLEPGTLKDGFRFTRVSRIGEMHPRSPLEGNRFFRGAGVGLPGGGPELVVDPIPTEPWPEWRYK